MFAAGRRENVVIADMLIYPSHQVGYSVQAWSSMLTSWDRVELELSIRSQQTNDFDGMNLIITLKHI